MSILWTGLPPLTLSPSPLKHLGNPWSLMYGSRGAGACRSWLARQWRVDAFWKSHTQATLISHTVFEWPLEKKTHDTKDSFCSLREKASIFLFPATSAFSLLVFSSWNELKRDIASNLCIKGFWVVLLLLCVGGMTEASQKNDKIFWGLRVHRNTKYSLWKNLVTSTTKHHTCCTVFQLYFFYFTFLLCNSHMQLITALFKCIVFVLFLTHWTLKQQSFLILCGKWLQTAKLILKQNFWPEEANVLSHKFNLAHESYTYLVNFNFICPAYT